MMNRILYIMNNKFVLKIFFLLLLIILTFFPLFDLFHSGLPVTHDGQDHVARIANFYQNLQEGNFIPRWAGNLNWGYGHPILMFLYPAPSYFASVFRLLGFSFVDSTKMVFALSFILSGFTMYLWLKEEVGEIAGLCGAFLYIYAPYRFVDFYVRGAIGEHVAFIFPPLILYFILKISKKYNFWMFSGGVLSFAGLILSHNAISLMFVPIIFIYIIYLAWQTKNKRFFLLNITLIISLGFGISAFFWVPAFFEGKYTLRDIVTTTDYSSRFVQIKDFFNTEWSYGGTDYLSKQIGIVQWLFIFCSFPVLYIFFNKNKNMGKNKLILLVGSLLIFLSSLFIMTSFSKFLWDNISLLQKFQFPWRFLSLIVFISSAIGGFVLYLFPKKLQIVLLSIVIILLLFTTNTYWKAKEFQYESDGFYSSIYNSTTDTGESSPIWSVRFMEKRADKYMNVLSGKTKIENIKHSSTQHIYKINAITKVKLRENTLYFPGWQVQTNGLLIPIEFQDPNNRGLMTFWLEKGEYILNITFSETKLRLVADIFTIISFIILIIWGILMNMDSNLKKMMIGLR